MSKKSIILGLGLSLLLTWQLAGCSNSDTSSPIPKSHPAYDFYQIAKSGPTTVEVCESFGGREIFPNDYTVTEDLAQGVFMVRQHSTGKEFLAISFAQGSMLVTICACCWEIEP